MDEAAVIATFLKRHFADRESGRVSSLAEYQSAFPGYEDLIAREFMVLEEGGNDRDHHSVAPSVPQRVAPYSVLELGDGGQCAVYLVAPDQVARFLTEAKSVPYLAMRSIEGETLARKIATARKAGDKRAQVSVNEVAGLIEKVAHALHATHEACIIHRDVKPGNILVTRSGDPILVDFSLARDADSDFATITQTGALFGTPAYRAPEQIATQTITPDRRSDIWSLGVTLYEVLRLERPFEAPTLEALHHAIMKKKPRGVGRLRSNIPKDLRVIVKTALQKDRDKRYQTAAALADDLRAFLDGGSSQRRRRPTWRSS